MFLSAVDKEEMQLWIIKSSKWDVALLALIIAKCEANSATGCSLPCPTKSEIESENTAHATVSLLALASLLL